jgi:hypothetical protein
MEPTILGRYRHTGLLRRFTPGAPSTFRHLDAGTPLRELRPAPPTTQRRCTGLAVAAFATSLALARMLAVGE